MKRSHLMLILATLSCAGVAQARQDAVSDEPEFVLEEWVEAYDDFIKAGEDGPATECLVLALAAYPELEPADQKAVVKAVEKGLGRRRKDGDNLLYSEVVKALGKMPGAGEKASLKALRNKNVDKRMEVLVFAVPALARHANAKHIPTLTKYLVHRDARVVAATVKGLGEFADNPERDRKQIVAALVKNYSTIFANSLQQGNRDREAGTPIKRADKKTLEMTQGAFESSLARLTGAKVRGASDWHRWYSDHRKKRWDPKKDRG